MISRSPSNRPLRPRPGRRAQRLGLPALALFALLLPAPAFAAGAPSPTDIERLSRERRATLVRPAAPDSRQSSSPALEPVLDALRRHLLLLQEPEGTFRPDAGFTLGPGPAPTVDPARQAMALWTLARLCTARPSPESQQAVLRLLNSFARRSQVQAIGAPAPLWADDAEIRTATVACLCLALDEFAAAQRASLTPEGRDLLARLLRNYRQWLDAMEIGDGSWAVAYIPVANERDTTPDPATDALCLLARVRRAPSEPSTERAALPPLFLRLVTRHVLPVWQEHRDPRGLVAFAPLACAALADYAALVPPAERDPWALLAVALAGWFLDELDAAGDADLLVPTFETVIHARRAAALLGDHDARARLDAAVAVLLPRLLRRQVQGPAWGRNPYGRTLTLPPPAHGGFLAADHGTRVRLDSTAVAGRLLTALAAPTPSSQEAAASPPPAAAAPAETP